MMVCEECKHWEVKPNKLPCSECSDDPEYGVNHWEPKEMDERSCKTCLYAELDGGEEPCRNCYDACCWVEKGQRSCSECVFEDVEWDQNPPCPHCFDFDRLVEKDQRACSECAFENNEWDQPPCKECKGECWAPKELAIDNVNHPPHYNWMKNIEAIDVCEQLNFCLGNAVKYILRADHKGNPIQDLRKAIWYLKREIERRMDEA